MVPALETALAVDNSLPRFNGRDGEAAPLHFVDQVEGGVFRSVCATILNFLANDLSLLPPMFVSL